jgi:hypothetical protein
MNNRAKLEQEIIKNLNSMGLAEIFLISSGSAEQINMIMMKLINQKHHICSARNKPTCCPILHILSAA